MDSDENKNHNLCCTIGAILGSLTLIGVIAIYLKIEKNSPEPIEVNKKYIGYVKER